jgi:hypothetical protein
LARKFVHAARVVGYKKGDVIAFEPVETGRLFNLDALIEKTAHTEAQSYAVRWDASREA